MTPWSAQIEHERREMTRIIRDIRCGYINAADVDRLHFFIAEALAAKHYAGPAQWCTIPVREKA